MFALFLVISIVITYIDMKDKIIPDKIILPSIVALVIVKFLNDNLSASDLIAAGIVFTVFVIPIVLNMDFGGGDIRFGVFCALFLGLEGIGWFMMFSGVIHLLILYMVKQKSFGFAPSMSLSALAVYGLGVV